MKDSLLPITNGLSLVFGLPGYYIYKYIYIYLVIVTSSDVHPHKGIVNPEGRVPMSFMFPSRRKEVVEKVEKDPCADGDAPTHLAKTVGNC